MGSAEGKTFKDPTFLIKQPLKPLGSYLLLLIQVLTCNYTDEPRGLIRGGSLQLYHRATYADDITLSTFTVKAPHHLYMPLRIDCCIDQF